MTKKSDLTPVEEGELARSFDNALKKAAHKESIPAKDQQTNDKPEPKAL